MPLPQRRVDLEAIGYRYDGEGHCRGCGVLMLWFTTPNQKKMPMTIIPGSENEEHQLLECHFGKCPNAEQFRKPKAKKMI
jgi:hypothetical protein